MHPHTNIFSMADYDNRKTKTIIALNFSQLDDESLIRQIGEKENHKAFTALVNRHSKRFYSIAYRILFNKNDAEDIVQKAFLKLWNRPKLWKQSKDAKFTTWFL